MMAPLFERDAAEVSKQERKKTALRFNADFAG
jgi:hypothetical protein